MALFEPEFGLIFWMLVVFLLLFGILARYAWPVIIQSVEKRAEFIDNGVKYAQEAINRKNQAEADARALLDTARKRQLEMLQEAERLKQTIVAEAKADAGIEAQKVLDAARRTVEQMKKEAEMQVRNQVAHLSLEIAGKVIRKDLETDKAQAELVEKFLEEMEKEKN